MVEDGGKLRGDEVVGGDVDMRGDPLGCGVSNIIAMACPLIKLKITVKLMFSRRCQSSRYQEQKELLLEFQGKVEEYWRRSRLEQVVRLSIAYMSG